MSRICAEQYLRYCPRGRRRRDGPASSWENRQPLCQGCMEGRWRKGGKGTGPFLTGWLVVGGHPTRTSSSCKRPSRRPPALISPWHTHKQTHKILASPSSHPPLSPQPNTSRQIQPGSLFQIHPQSTQLSVLRDPISGQTSMIGISTRRVLRRSLHLLSPTSSPKLSSTLRRG